MYIVKETQLNLTQLGAEVETLDDELKKTLSQSFIIFYWYNKTSSIHI
jgi:hypothetical protein